MRAEEKAVAVAPMTLVGYLAVSRPGESGPVEVDVGSGLPVRIEEGQRVHLHAHTDAPAVLYVVHRDPAHTFRRLARLPLGSGLREALAGGWVPPSELSSGVVVLVASAAELPWAEALGLLDCALLKDSPRPERPTTACEHLHGLAWEVPPRIRSPHARLERAGLRLPDGTTLQGVTARRTASPSLVAVEFILRPR